MSLFRKIPYQGNAFTNAWKGGDTPGPVATVIPDPSDYYADSQLEPWDVAADWLSADGYRGGLILAILKYLKRYRKKDGIRDLEKAQRYLNELLNFERCQCQKKEAEGE